MSVTPVSLLERASRGSDAESWRRLTEIYTRVLHGWLARHHLQSCDVDDLVQDVLLCVARELPAFRHNGRPGAFRCWLRRVLVNRLRAYRTGWDRQPTATGRTDFHQWLRELEDPVSALSRLWDAEHDRQVAAGLMELVRGRVNEASWQAFRRTALEGASPAEVAEELGLTPNAVRAAKCRVLRELREEGGGLID